MGKSEFTALGLLFPLHLFCSPLHCFIVLPKSETSINNT